MWRSSLLFYSRYSVDPWSSGSWLDIELGRASADCQMIDRHVNGPCVSSLLSSLSAPGTLRLSYRSQPVEFYSTSLLTPPIHALITSAKPGLTDATRPCGSSKCSCWTVTHEALADVEWDCRFQHNFDDLDCNRLRYPAGSMSNYPSDQSVVEV